MIVWKNTYSKTWHSQQASLSSESRLTHNTPLSCEAGRSWRPIRPLTERQDELLRRLRVHKLLEDSECDSPRCRPLQSRPSLRGCPRGPEVPALLDVLELRSLPGSQEDPSFPRRQSALLHLQHPETHTGIHRRFETVHLLL